MKYIPKKTDKYICMFFIFFSFSFKTTVVLAETYIETYTIEKVIDGESLLLTNGKKVHLLGISAPKNRTCSLGITAKTYLQYRLGIGKDDRRVILEYGKQKKSEDGSLFAYVYLLVPTAMGDTSHFGKNNPLSLGIKGSHFYKVLLNAQMIADGYAKPQNSSPNHEFHQMFEKLYREAKKNKSGLWGAYQLSKDPLVCNDYKTPQIKRDCLNYFLNRINDVNVCIDWKITDEMRKHCYRTVAQNVNDSAVCEHIQDRKERFSCYGKIDPQTCVSEETISLRDDCYLNAAITAPPDFSLCRSIESQEIRGLCYDHIKFHQNPDLCKQYIPETHYTYDNCFSSIARETQNISICDYIKDGRWKWICYGEVAEALSDSSLCEYIEDEIYKEHCLSFKKTNTK